MKTFLFMYDFVNSSDYCCCDKIQAESLEAATKIFQEEFPEEYFETMEV